MQSLMTIEVTFHHPRLEIMRRIQPLVHMGKGCDSVGWPSAVRPKSISSFLVSKTNTSIAGRTP
jgi:hypothetical protein